jgi:hypothetical protein
MTSPIGNGSGYNPCFLLKNLILAAQPLTTDAS